MLVKWWDRKPEHSCAHGGRYTAFIWSEIRRYGHYFFGCKFWWGYYSRVQPADFNDSWIRYARAIQWLLLDTVSSKHSHSVLLLAMETSCTTRTQQSHHCLVTVVRNYAHAAYSSRDYCSREVFILLRAPDCTATIWGQCLFEEIRKALVSTGWPFLSFE